jgi:hypothetical protein
MFNFTIIFADGSEEKIKNLLNYEADNGYFWIKEQSGRMRWISNMAIKQIIRHEVDS